MKGVKQIIRREKDPCENCPMYWTSCDYWGEWDEGCEAELDGWFDGKDYIFICKMPIFIKKLFLRYIRWKEDQYWKKYIKDYEMEEEKSKDME